MGTATMMGFEAAVPQTRGIKLKNWIGWNTSNSIPIPPKRIAMPPRTKATGKPQNSAIASTANRKRAR